VESYESDCLTEYVSRIPSKLIIARKDNKDKIASLSYIDQDIAPQFQKLESWIKQKLLELKAYNTTIEELESLIAKRIKIFEKKESALQKIKLLKNKPDKEKEVVATENEVKRLEEDSTNLTGMLNIIITYMTKIFLPTFKRRQLMLFYNVVQQFFNADSSAFTKQADVWTALLSDKILKHF